MIFSQRSLFSDKQAITATALSTNVMYTGDKGTPYRGNGLIGDIGKGNKIPLAVSVTESFNNLTSMTITVETGATESLGTVLHSATVPLADLVAGYQLPIDFVPDGVQDYLGLKYTVTGSAPTTGKVMAGLIVGQRPTNLNGV